MTMTNRALWFVACLHRASPAPSPSPSCQVRCWKHRRGSPSHTSRAVSSTWCWSAF